MITNFYVAEFRLEELKLFIRSNLPTARFIDNPYKVGNKYSISLEMEIKDANKLNLLQNKWYDEDNAINSPSKNIFRKIFKK